MSISRILLIFLIISISGMDHDEQRAMLQILWTTQEAENHRVQNLLFPRRQQDQQPTLILESDDSSSNSDDPSTDSSVSSSSTNDSADEFMREPPNKKSRKGMRFRKRRLLSLYRTQTGNC